MNFESIVWDNDRNVIKIIDQTLLPVKKLVIDLVSVEDVYKAIKQLKVRGAPLIGICAGYGSVIALDEAAEKVKPGEKNGINLKEYIGLLKKEFLDKVGYIGSSRPTAYNMFFVLDRMKEKFLEIINSRLNSLNENQCTLIREISILRSVLKKRLTEAAIFFHEEDASLCEKIGEFGLTLLNPNDTVLTHCNAGSLATSAWGTALAPVYKAHEKGYNITVYSDETRPLLQGSRLTAYELVEKGIKTYTICDNMAGYVMKLGKIDKIIVGADRICKNGDFANKIGTYSVAVLAKHHNIPFYVAAPYTTFDLSLESGKNIPIEERKKEEIIHGFGKQTAPENVNVFNPAFDVTQSGLVTAFITDRGVIFPPFRENIEKMIGDKKE